MNIRQYAEQARSKWSNLSSRNRLIIASAIAATLALIVVGILWSKRPDYVVLYSGLSPEDAQAIEDELRSARVPYKRSPDGSSITVPSSEVYKVRMQLANKGLPEAGSAVGFEGFDKTDFGTTDFVQRIKYQRALQVELARTMMQIKGVSSARVHIVLPNESVFTERQEPAKASVVLKLRPGVKLSESQVNGIIHLVASAVEGLSKENISIIDSHGNLLNFPGQDQVLNDSQLRYKKAVESDLAYKVQKMLDKVLGQGKSTVQVTADIDFDITETSSETYDPEKSVVKSEQVQSYESKGSGNPMGIPGMTTGITPNPPVSYNAGAEYKGNESNVTYEISKTIQRTTHTPGKIKRLSVAVVVDNKIVDGNPVPWTPAELDDLKNLVKNAVGFDVTRGDPDVEIKNIPFDTSLQQELDQAEKALRGEKLRKALIKAGIILAVIVAVFLILRIMSRKVASRGFIEETPMLKQPIEPQELPAPEKQELSAPQVPPPDVVMTEFQRHKRAIIEAIDKEPELVAQIIRNWMK